jgi:hypothetical protein
MKYVVIVSKTTVRDTKARGIGKNSDTKLNFEKSRIILRMPVGIFFSYLINAV